MAAVEEEIEEGEITDSDSCGEKEMQKVPVPQYSMFDNKSGPAAAVTTRRSSHLSHSESDPSEEEEEDYSDEDNTKKRRFNTSYAEKGPHQPSKFVNPNFVTNGSKMPPMPKHSNRSIWGSVLQEQILTAEVKSFGIEKKLPGDREVESYDYSHAKEDDRPFPTEDEVNNTKEDLFGEVVDFEKAASKQYRDIKRKPVSERLGKRNHVRQRLHLPPVTENSTVEDVTHFISSKLEESKIHLIRRVVQVVGQAKSLDLLRETEKVEAGGGMLILNGTRRRTAGGVFLTLLKMDKKVSKEQLDDIFEEENKWSLELRKRKKARARRRRKERLGAKEPRSSSEAAGDKEKSSTGLVDDGKSHTNIEVQTSSSRNQTGYLSDSGEATDSEEEVMDAEDSRSQSANGLRQQAAGEQAKEPSALGDADAFTLDDVLDLEVDDDFID